MLNALLVLEKMKKWTSTKMGSPHELKSIRKAKSILKYYVGGTNRNSDNMR